MRFLREPLFHFFLIGLAVFGLFFWLNPPDPDAAASDRIVVDSQDVERLRAQFEATWRRYPTAEELQGLVNSLVREEILVREARKLGLDQGDSVIRSRMVQKMDFLTTSVAQSMDPGDEALRTFIKESPERFATRPRVAFEQILLSPDATPEEVAQALNAGTPPEDLGTATLLPAAVPPLVAAAVDGTFGRGTFEQIANLPQGEWAGPVRSSYGTHFVRVAEFYAGALPPFEEIRDSVLQSWRSEQAEKLTEAQLAALMSKYEIVLPDPNDPTRGPSQ